MSVLCRPDLRELGHLGEALGKIRLRPERTGMKYAKRRIFKASKLM